MSNAWMPTAALIFTAAPGRALASDGASPTDAPSAATELAAEAVDTTVDLLQLALGATVGFALGVVAMLVFQRIIRHLLRKTRTLLSALRPTARPLQLALAAAGAWIGMSSVLRSARPDWYGAAWHSVIIAEIIAATWFASALVRGAEGAILETLRQSGQSRYRKVQTQMQILQRVVAAAIWLLGFAAILLTFPSARTVGASLLASAGVVSVIAGIAAQTTFGNVFAGLQLAFSDSIRVGDVINWEGTRCNVEEITLTYVVLRVWDGRRLIVPSSKMTTQTFENWTRRSSELLNHVDFRLDWSAPIPEIRARLAELLDATDLWDGRVGVLQVRDTDGETIQVSALVSARNSSTMTDLRNYIREEMVAWLQREHPAALPHTRYFNYNWEETARPGGFPAAVMRGDGAGSPSPRADTGQSAGRGEGDAQEQLTEERTGAQRAGTQRTGEGRADAPQAATVGRDAAGAGYLDQRAEAAGNTAAGGKTPVNRERHGAGPAGPDAPARIPIADRFAHDAHYSGAKTIGHASSVFSGSLEAEARERDFESGGEAAAAERAEAARRKQEARVFAGEADKRREGKRQAKSRRSTPESAAETGAAEAGAAKAGARGESGGGAGEGSGAQPGPQPHEKQGRPWRK